MKVFRGFGFIKLGDRNYELSNYSPPPKTVNSLIYRSCNTGQNIRDTRLYASPFFTRYGNYRYQLSSHVAMQRMHYLQRNVGFSSLYIDSLASPSSLSTDNLRRVRFDYVNVPQDYTPWAFGAIELAFPVGGTNFPQDPPPLQVYGNPSIARIEIPGTKIGNLFPHAIGANSLFNIIGEVPLSAGSVNIGGCYNPDETNLFHRSYRVYFTKDGGTGIIDNTVGQQTGGQVTTASTTFTDGNSGGHFSAGDVGKFIAIRDATNPSNNGTFEITSFTDSNNVVLDNEIIGQDFTTESGLSWTLREGPIGEYFYQSRLFIKGNVWTTNYHNTNNQGVSFVSLEVPYENRRGVIAPTGYRSASHRVGCHDGGACWWSAGPSNLGQYSLARWINMSPFGLDYPLEDGTLQNIPLSWDTVNTHCRGVLCDDEKKLWVWRESPDSTPSTVGQPSLMRIDPFPLGDATNPSVISSFGGQSSHADNALPSSDLREIIIDTSKTLVNNDVIWALCYHSTAEWCGVAYTMDYGNKWYRIKCAQTLSGTVTTNATTTVIGTGTAFLTNLCSGDWITIDGEVAIVDQVNSDTEIILEDPTVSSSSGLTIIRGFLDYATEAPVGYSVNSLASATDTPSSFSPLADFSTNGELFYANNARNRLIKIDPVNKTKQNLAASGMTNGIGNFNTTFKSICVSRHQNNFLGSPSEFENNVWVGAVGIGAFDGGAGVTRLYNASLGLSPNLASPEITRYTTAAVNNFPIQSQLPAAGASPAGSATVRCDSNTGEILLTQGNNDAVVGSLIRDLNDVDFGRFYLDPFTKSNAAVAINSPAGATQSFDRWGLGLQYYHLNAITLTAQDNVLYRNNYLAANSWLTKMWDGENLAWKTVPLYGNLINYDFKNSSGGPFIFDNNSQTVPTVGYGVKRMSEHWENLEHGILIKFDRNPATTSENLQFLADETITFTCFVGDGKDNITEATYGIEQSLSAAILRDPSDEPEKQIRNIWTQDKGLDGGWVGSDANVNTFVPFNRGIAEPTSGTVGNDGDYSLNITGQSLQRTNSSPQQTVCAYRQKPEGEFTSDGAVTTNVFTTSGAHSFTINDLGKSIIIEGSGLGNNGQYVITQINSTTEVLVDINFSAAESNLRWKLENIPSINRLVLYWADATITNVAGNDKLELYSSSDRGVSWDLRKTLNRYDNVAENEGRKADSGIYIDPYSVVANSYQATTASTQPSVVFDLSDLPINSKRRKYWKVVWTAEASINTNTQKVGSIFIFGNSGELLVPDSNKILDADDPRFIAMNPQETYIVPFESAVTGSVVDLGSGDCSNTFTSVGATFYEENGANNASLAIGGNITTVGSPFHPHDIGKIIRISNASNSANNGYAQIITFVNANEVITSKAFIAESNSFDWAMLKFGEGDYLRLKDSTPLSIADGGSLESRLYEIVDIPSTDTIIVSRDIPIVTGVHYDINRAFSLITDTWKTTNGFSLGQSLGYTTRRGTLAYGTPLEFRSLGSNTGATSNADTDGDGRTDTIVLPTLLSSDILDNADHIKLVGATTGSRVYEIRNIMADSPTPGETTVRVWYDEILPNDNMSYEFYQSKWFKCGIRRLVITASEDY